MRWKGVEAPALLSLIRLSCGLQLCSFNNCIKQCSFQIVKGIVHPKIKIPLSFTQLQVVPNMYEVFFFCYTKDVLKQHFPIPVLGLGTAVLKNVGNQTVDGSHWPPRYGTIKNTVEVNDYHQKKSYRFGTIRGWNDDRIFILGELSYLIYIYVYIYIYIKDTANITKLHLFSC